MLKQTAATLMSTGNVRYRSSKERLTMLLEFYERLSMVGCGTQANRSKCRHKPRGPTGKMCLMFLLLCPAASTAAACVCCDHIRNNGQQVENTRPTAVYLGARCRRSRVSQPGHTKRYAHTATSSRRVTSGPIVDCTEQDLTTPSCPGEADEPCSGICSTAAVIPHQAKQERPPSCWRHRLRSHNIHEIMCIMAERRWAREINTWLSPCRYES